jgi:hypothetical protein
MNDEVKNPTKFAPGADENYENLKAVITALTNDYEKFKQKKVKAAGQRVRASLLNTKKLCDTLRKQVKEEINSIPIKHRALGARPYGALGARPHRSKSILEDGKTSEDDKTSEDEKPEEKKEKEKPKRKRKANLPKTKN